MAVVSEASGVRRHLFKKKLYIDQTVAVIETSGAGQQFLRKLCFKLMFYCDLMVAVLEEFGARRNF